jgi:peptidoglycan hydrolase CwlO-like protein
MKNQKVQFNRLNLRILSVIILSTLFLMACPGDQQRRADQEFQAAQEERLQELRELRDDIDNRIDNLNDEIDEAQGDVQAALEDARDDLREQRDRIDQEIDNIETASRDNWDQVEERAARTAEQVRIRTNEIYRDVEQWVEGEWDDITTR